MITLGIETSGRVGSVAIRRDGTLVAERFSEPARGHGGRILAEIDALLGELDIALDQVDLFAAGAGPGSFTGVRVGLATVTSLAWALGRPATAVDTLQALAGNGIDAGGLIAPVIDARKQEVYGALYRRQDGGLTCVLQASVASPASWAAAVAEAACGETVRWLGSGTDAYPDVFSASELDPRTRGARVAELAEALFQKHGAGGLPAPVPRYVRPSEAEVKFGAAPAHAAVTALDDIV